MKKHKKPVAVFYYLAACILSLIYKWKYGLVIDRRALADLKGPALVIAPHISEKDHWILGITLLWHRVTFVLSEHFMHYRLLRPVLKLVRPITKRMYSVDVGTILSIARAKKSGCIIVLFPEGRLTCSGHSVQVTEGTAALVKKMGLPVYNVVGNGAYLTFPKWARYKRRGKIFVTTEKVFSADDIASLTVSEIDDIIRAAIVHDEEKAMAGVTYKCKDFTKGLDGILYRCPICTEEHTLITEKGRIRCRCGLDASLDGEYRIHGAPFHSINAWFDWQESIMDIENTILESEATIGAVNSKGNIVSNAGNARVYMDSMEFQFHGTVFGEKVNFSLPLEKIRAFPMKVADHFDVYYNQNLYRISVEPERRDVIKWVLFLEKAMKDKRKKID